MRKHILVLFAVVFCLQLWAVDPSVSLTSYYATIDGKATNSNDDLRKQLCTIISIGYVTIKYSNLPSLVYAAESDPSDFYIGDDKTMEDIYSSKPYKSTDNGSSATTCGTGWNKEHTVPQSYFNEASPMVSDAHHIFPTDIKMNSTRSNYPYGENNASKACDNYGYGHLGTSTFSGYTGTVFDPGDGGENGSYKGDLARVYFYMVTRYRTTNFTQDNQNNGQISFTYTNGVADLTDYMKNLMLKWHNEDPVSEKELIRNNAIYAHQKNRNPFVDYPELVEYIWGEHKGENVDLSSLVSGYEGGNGEEEEVSQAYYASLNSKSGSALRSALTVLLYNHHIYYDKYDGASSGTENWDFPFDYDPNTGYVWDIYTTGCNMENTIGSTASCCCSGLNREHLVCQSTFGGNDNKDKVPQYADRHSLFLTDAYTNQRRNDQAFGEVDSTQTISKGSCETCNDYALGCLGKVGKFAELYESTEDVYEVGNEYKGDVARAVLYMVIRYAERTYCRLPDGAKYNNSTTGVGKAVSSDLTTANNYAVTDWKNAGTTTSTTIGQMFSTDLSVNYGLSDYGKAILLKWHRQDKVSQKEIDRNNGVESVQGNRNPFIDYPYLVEYIWGEHAGENVDLTELVGSFESAFVPGVSDGSKNSTVTKYTITWSKNGVTSTTQVAQGTRPTPPSVDDCSTTRVFRGWTTNSSYSGNGSDLMKVQADFPAASANATYYAVFADKEGSGSGAETGTVMWAETWTGTTTKTSPDDAATPSANYGNGTTVYNSGSVTYTQSANSVYCRNENTGGGTAPELLLTQSQTWTISNIPTGGASELLLTYTSNNSKSSVTCSTSGASVSGSSKAYTIITGGAATITLTFSASGNTRLDDISLTVKTTNNAATYSNFSTQCSATPQVTVTFHKNDGSSTTTTQQVPENTSTALNANTWSRTHYTFLGWATSASGEKVYNDGASVTLSANLDLYAVWKEDDKYTVKWHTAEGTTSVVYYTGTNLALPSTPEACEADVRVFKGWTAQSGYKHTSDAPSDMFTSASGTVTANADYYAVYADKEVEKTPILVTDTLTCVLINQSSYGDWTNNSSYSAAKYAGNTSGGSNYIQMRASSNSGIVTTTSGGIVRRVELKWKSNTASGRKIDIYGKKSAYSSAADLYSSEAATKGALLGSIAYGTSTALDITVDSTFIGLRSSSNALYVDTIAIVWQTGENVTTTYSNYSTKCSAKVTVTFHKNDGSSVTTTQEISENKSTALTACPWAREHFTFDGWATSADGDKVYDDGQSVTIDADLDLYAVWTADPQYTVTCYSNGEKVDEVKGYAGEGIIIYDPEACDGYTFVGWSTTTCPTEVTEKPQTHVLTTIPDHDVTYYAIFGRQVEGGSTITNDYKKITTSEELTTANYVIAAYYNDGNSNLYGAMSTNWKDNFYLAPVTVTPNDQDIIYTKEGTIIWNITVVSNLASISNETAGNLYVEQSTSGTYYNIKLGDNTTENKFTHSVTSGNWLFTSAVYTDRVLEFYAGGARWAIYKSADAPIYLYKQIVEEGHTTYYVSSPSCSGGATAVENTVDSITPRKVLIGSEMYIFIGEHCYDVTGKRIR